MMGWYGGAIGRLGWLGLCVFWLILLGLIMGPIARLRPGSSNKTTSPTGESPVESLNRRLACGDLGLADWQAQRVALMAPADGSTNRSRDVR